MLNVKTKYGPNKALAGDNISTNNSTENQLHQSSEKTINEDSTEKN